MREKRKALNTGKQSGKENESAKRTGGCENSVLAPITKWKNIVLANEKNMEQERRGAGSGTGSHDEVVSRLFNSGESREPEQDASAKDR